MVIVQVIWLIFALSVPNEVLPFTPSEQMQDRREPRGVAHYLLVLLDLGHEDLLDRLVDVLANRTLDLCHMFCEQADQVSKLRLGDRHAAHDSGQNVMLGTGEKTYSPIRSNAGRQQRDDHVPELTNNVCPSLTELLLCFKSSPCSLATFRCI